MLSESGPAVMYVDDQTAADSNDSSRVGEKGSAIL